MTGQDAWAYTFRADDASGACCKIAMPPHTPVEEVQAAVFAALADITRTIHNAEIEVEWSSLRHDSWVGRIRRASAAVPARGEGAADLSAYQAGSPASGSASGSVGKSVG